MYGLPSGYVEDYKRPLLLSEEAYKWLVDNDEYQKIAHLFPPIMPYTGSGIFGRGVTASDYAQEYLKNSKQTYFKGEYDE